MRILIAATLAVLVPVASAVAAPATRYLELVNTAHSRLTSLEIAGVDSGDWHAVDLGGALSGGGDSTTVAIAVDGGCRHDLRMTFADGRRLLQRAFDVCSYRTYHTGRYLPRERTTGTAFAQHGSW